jgi:hypothetical protein
VDGRDTDVFSKTDTLGQDRFGPARAADYRLTPPVDALARGPYLLSITATRGTETARRDVRVTLR